MKKVIKHGYSKYEAQCYNCKCVFQYELEDIEKGKVECPDCGYECNHSPMDFILSSQIEE